MEFERPTDDERRALHAFEDEGREAGKPAVGLDFRTTWCPRHLEPYKARWPQGAATAMVMLFQEFAEDARVQELGAGDAMKLPALVAEHSPLCCYVDEKALQRIYEETGVG